MESYRCYTFAITVKYNLENSKETKPILLTHIFAYQSLSSFLLSRFLFIFIIIILFREFFSHLFMVLQLGVHFLSLSSSENILISPLFLNNILLDMGSFLSALENTMLSWLPWFLMRNLLPFKSFSPVGKVWFVLLLL